MSSSNPPDPLLVLVSGPPASGKSTLAREAATALGVPVLGRDEVRAALGDTLGLRAPELHDVLVSASFRVFYTLLDALLPLGGVVAETNFHRGPAEPDLRPFCTRTRAVLLHCNAPHDLIVQRSIDRFERGERHWSTHDAERIADVRAGIVLPMWQQTVPLDLSIPKLMIDTTAGYEPVLPDILRFVHEKAGVPTARLGTVDESGRTLLQQ